MPPLCFFNFSFICNVVKYLMLITKWLMKQQIVIQYIIRKCKLKFIIIKYYNKLTLRIIYNYYKS